MSYKNTKFTVFVRNKLRKDRDEMSDDNLLEKGVKIAVGRLRHYSTYISKCKDQTEICDDCGFAGHVSSFCRNICTHCLKFHKGECYADKYILDGGYCPVYNNSQNFKKSQETFNDGKNTVQPPTDTVLTNSYASITYATILNKHCAANQQASKPAKQDPKPSDKTVFHLLVDQTEHLERLNSEQSELMDNLKHSQSLQKQLEAMILEIHSSLEKNRESVRETEVRIRELQVKLNEKIQALVNPSTNSET